MKKHLIGTILFMSMALSASMTRALTTDYTYDSAGRLARADYDINASITYEYDVNGNLLQRTVYNEQISFGSLGVTLTPEAPQWRRTPTSIWRNSGTWEENVLAGDYTVEFSVVPGWNSQPSQTVSLMAGELKSINVNFTENTDEYLVSTLVTGSGTITGSGTYIYNDLVQLTAQPAPGYAFFCWKDQNGTVLSSDQSIVFRATSGLTYTAYFRPTFLPPIIKLLL